MARLSYGLEAKRKENVRSQKTSIQNEIPVRGNVTELDREGCGPKTEIMEAAKTHGKGSSSRTTSFAVPHSLVLGPRTCPFPFRALPDGQKQEASPPTSNARIDQISFVMLRLFLLGLPDWARCR